MEDCIQVFTTVPTGQDGHRLAQTLVEERLAACVQVIGPIQSTYRWQGKVETAGEHLCLIKTTAAGFDRLRHRIQVLHPYDVPEIVAVPITAAADNYFEWLKSSVGQPGS